MLGDYKAAAHIYKKYKQSCSLEKQPQGWGMRAGSFLGKLGRCGFGLGAEDIA